MSFGRGRRRGGGINIWPGFVDALSSLLLVIIFVLLAFVLAQFYLGQALSGREEKIALLSRQLGQLADMLALEKQNAATLEQEVVRLRGAADEQKSRMAGLEEQARAGAAASERLALLESEFNGLLAQKTALEESAVSQNASLEGREAALAEAREKASGALAEIDLLNRQLDGMRRELQRLADALEASEAQSAEQKVQIVDLGKRLNAALASKVEELARYRSDFFGKMREVLGNRSGVRIEGDRFVVQSELLFASGSDALGEQGRLQLSALASALKKVAADIPPDINWVLRIDGHTDLAPIKSDRFPSNWELSTARAAAVVKFLMAEGIPGRRLAAAGFASYQPIDRRDSPEAYARNRRIEIRFDQAFSTE